MQHIETNLKPQDDCQSTHSILTTERFTSRESSFNAHSPVSQQWISTLIHRTLEVSTLLTSENYHKTTEISHSQASTINLVMTNGSTPYTIQNEVQSMYRHISDAPETQVHSCGICTLFHSCIPTM